MKQMVGVIEEGYVLEPEHRPNSPIGYAEGIPLIDLSPLFSQELTSSIDGLVSEIGEACRSWGFFQVINHNVPPSKVQRVEDAGRRFFLLPSEEKNKIRKTETQVLGFSDSEHTKNVRDWKQVFDFFANDPTSLPLSPDPDHTEVVLVQNVWPLHPPELSRNACKEYVKEMEKLAYKLLEVIALSLGLEPTRFHGFYHDNTTYMRLNYYKPCPEPELALGVGRHKDGGALTILYQDDVGGLQVKRKEDGEWLTVKPTPDALIVNVGDVFQVWSNDVYESVEHRAAVNSEKERFSIPFFFNPAHHTMVEPLKEMTDGERPPRYRAYNWGKFYRTKRLSNFQRGELENLQVSHFRIV